MEIVDFTDRTSNKNRKKRGRKVNEFVAISYADVRRNSYKLWDIKQGTPLIDLAFLSEDEAAKFASWIFSLYRDYLDLIPEGLDLFSLCKWSVDNGIKVYMTLEELKGKTITLDKFASVFHNVKDEQWTRGM